MKTLFKIVVCVLLCVGTMCGCVSNNTTTYYERTEKTVYWDEDKNMWDQYITAFAGFEYGQEYSIRNIRHFTCADHKGVIIVLKSDTDSRVSACYLDDDFYGIYRDSLDFYDYVWDMFYV